MLKTLSLDQGLDLAAIWKDVVKRPYITVGMVSFLILVPLAVTSNNALIKRMGGATWQRLHRLVYVAAAAAALHFIMLVRLGRRNRSSMLGSSRSCCCTGLPFDAWIALAVRNDHVRSAWT